ncbi:Pentatricopeptide repeat-containing protein [Ooceraea biroi]|nr:Pentatricopeptide repeat-containing protein [Ooceraea biroi]
MDELEKKEEEFQDNEASVPRWMKHSLGQYGKMIKSHLSKNDLNSAIKVLDLIKEKRDKPTMYLYNLLIRGFARQGDVKQCFGLYNKAKQRGLIPNAATYTSLFNACAVSDNSTLALKQLNGLRQSLYEKQFPLNDTHYNVMVKAYSWHKKIIEAFQLVDEMRDKRMPFGEKTYNSLLHAAIADKEVGLRYALTVWHLMRRYKVKPTVATYNLFLRAIRDTNLGSLKVNTVFIEGMEQTKILLKDSERPDLLASPPVLSKLLPLTSKEQMVTQECVKDVALTDSVDLNDVLINNRLILFGGLEGWVERMANDDVKPDAKTITLLLDLIPNTVLVENLLITIAEKNKVELDIDFYNMLIKRRNMRGDFKAAKEVISITERKELSPNVMTFGVLALGCHESREAKEFLRGLDAFGYRPNAVIMSTLINNACRKKDFELLLFVMNYMRENKIEPNEQAINNLKEFSQNLSEIEKPRGKYSLRKKKRLKKNIEDFEEQYPKWQKMIKDDE